MPRRRAAPRLYLDRARGQWIIRDGSSFIRTGRAECDRAEAEKQLARYLGQKHQPEGGPDPLIADVLLVYTKEHVPQTKSVKNTLYNIASLARWFGDRPVSSVTAQLCRAYAAERTPAAARRDLETLRAAIRYWVKERGPISVMAGIALPARNQHRDRWLTRAEAARLLKAAKRGHLRRFILVGIYTGTRPGAILRLKWDQIDLSAGVMRRRASGEAEDARKRTPPVRLGRRILSHLRRWHRLDIALGVEYVCHYDGRRVQKLRRSFPDAVKKAGLTRVTPHTLRHTRATWLMQAGVDIWEAAGHLGMTVEMLEKTYGHHHPDWQTRAAEV